jgi:superfamily II DNA or RNA helicase
MSNPFNLFIIGEFVGKTKKYSEGIIELKFEDFLASNKDNIDKLKKFADKDNIIIFSIQNTDTESVLYTFDEHEIIIKGNSKVFTADKIIDMIFDSIANDKTNVQVTTNTNSSSANPIEKKLLPYQIPHLYQLLETIKVNNCILDSSDTGTGKTYVALALAHILNLEPFIICPKSVIINWINVSRELGIKLFGVSNYECIKGGKYYTEDCEKVVCPYLDVQTSARSVEDSAQQKVTAQISFKFQLPSNVIVIFDEAHRCKNHKSVTSKLLDCLAKSKNKILLLSATITDKINCFKPFGVVFGFYEKTENFRIWIKRQMIAYRRKLAANSRILSNTKNELDDEVLQIKIIHDSIFPQKGSRLKICELGDMFPSNQVVAKLYYCKNHEQIQKEYDNIKMLFEEYKNKEESARKRCILAELIYARMRIEQYKTPIFIDLANEAFDNGYSVVIFTCFKETMINLSDELGTDCLIHGEQSLEERNACIEDFQSNKKKCIICMISAGSVGLSLHDIHGGHPRMSLINPSWNGVEMKQCLGRIHRAGGKTPALQRLIYCAKTYEEDICKLVDKKLDIIEKVNNGVLVQNGIDIEIVKQMEDKFEVLESTKDIEDKTEAKNMILKGRNKKENYKSALNDADEANQTVKKLKNKQKPKN